MQFRKPWMKKLLYGVVFFGLAVWGVDWWFNPSWPTLSASPVESIEIHLFNETYSSPKAGQAASSNVVTDEQVIRKLLALFAAAERVSEHKGVTSGQIVFRLKDGGREEV